jgi:uncharacterized protein YjbI with pentapeptide repeats
MDDTATQVTRIGLTFLGTAAFCLLSLLSPDSALLGGSEKINVPLAGPVSFFGFMLLGPAVLIVLRAYLQIYVEHSDRLDRLARSVSVMRAPTLVPLQNSLIRLFSGLIFYLLLPVALLLFAWKAAVFPAWGSGLFGVAVAVIVGHVMLPLSRFTWRSKALLSAGAAALAWGLIFGLGPLRRPFDLGHANLSGQWLVSDDLSRANLRVANLNGANLLKANLVSADLSGAHLDGADLSGADLSGADLYGADLNGAYLSYANLSSANLDSANLLRANLFHANLSGAYLSGAHLDGANLSSADLSGATLLSADLNGANLSYANLSSATLLHADLNGADLSVANLSSADLSGATLLSADLSSTRLIGANLHGALLNDANLRSANLSDANLDGACGNATTKLPEGLTLKPCSTDDK